MKRKFAYRKIMMSVMVFIIAVNYIDRGALAYAAEPIMNAFNLSASDWGYVLGFFGYGYIVGTFLGGALADKKGPKFVWIFACTAWSLLAIATAFAGEIGVWLFGSAVAGFALCRVLFGLAEGPVYANMNRTIANWIPTKDRTFYVGVGLIGTPLGAMLTAPVAVGLLSIADWRWMFISLGVIGLIWVVVWNKLFTDMPEDNRFVTKEELAIIRKDQVEDEPEDVQKGQTAWFEFFKHPSLVLNAASFFGFNYINFLILTWTPLYLQQMYGFELRSLWYVGMIPWVGAVFTVFLGGKLSQYLLQKTGSFKIAKPGVIITSMLLTAICFVFIPFAPNAWVVLALMSIGNAINSLPQAVYWSIVLDASSKRTVGTFSGLTHGIITSASIIAPTATGILVALYGYNSMFFVAAGIAFIGMFLMFFVRPPANWKAEQERMQKTS
ncbi:MFS transporter [Shouchella sp. JSM 1781072]|uniref:MFS transporter n=1 Tax=Bacillaceae TaxID=186817 RepID=UPI0020CFF861|nr:MULTISPECIES: MFS transporter [Bacillaceae]UTR05826.1 MFS transporter [Alkalihalobacillus sp. LMS6]